MCSMGGRISPFKGTFFCESFWLAGQKMAFQAPMLAPHDPNSVHDLIWNYREPFCRRVVIYGAGTRLVRILRMCIVIIHDGCREKLQQNPPMRLDEADGIIIMKYTVARWHEPATSNQQPATSNKGKNHAG